MTKTTRRTPLRHVSHSKHHHTQLPPFLQDMASDARQGNPLQRREFIALASLFGATTATAYGMLGLRAPQKAHAQRQGGVLRVAMSVRRVEDPRTFEWPEMASVARQFCENLVRWERNFDFSPYLLEAWEVNDDATEYILKARRNVTWSNGDPFHAEDIVFNLTRWCERDVEGNSMAGRMNALVDQSSGKAKEGAITKLDDYTVRLRLDEPDITIIPGMVDYTAILVHRDFERQGGDLTENPIGTGPFELVSIDVGKSAEVRRRTNGEWWKGTIALDGVQWTDYGIDPSAEISAWEAGEVDVNYQTVGNFVNILDELGARRTEVVTGATVVVRTNIDNPPYDNQQLRRAIQLAVDNETVLRIGFDNRGQVAENHHVGLMHPEYFPLPDQKANPRRARRELRRSGHRDFEFDLVSIDDDYRRNTADIVASQMRRARMKVKRTILPSGPFWENWATYPFSTTDWLGRPFGTQVLALAYRSGEAWNETAYNNPEFDAKLAQANATANVKQRRIIMEDVEKILQDSGIIVQPYWRSLYCHIAPRVKNYAVHQTFEQQFDDTYLEA